MINFLVTAVHPSLPGERIKRVEGDTRPLRNRTDESKGIHALALLVVGKKLEVGVKVVVVVEVVVDEKREHLESMLTVEIEVQVGVEVEPGPGEEKMGAMDMAAGVIVASERGNQKKKRSDREEIKASQLW